MLLIIFVYPEFPKLSKDYLILILKWNKNVRAKQVSQSIYLSFQQN